VAPPQSHERALGPDVASTITINDPEPSGTGGSVFDQSA
jgi:hypothetical protein